MMTLVSNGLTKGIPVNLATVWNGELGFLAVHAYALAGARQMAASTVVSTLFCAR